MVKQKLSPKRVKQIFRTFKNKVPSGYAKKIEEALDDRFENMSAEETQNLVKSLAHEVVDRDMHKTIAPIDCDGVREFIYKFTSRLTKEEEKLR